MSLKELLEGNELGINDLKGLLNIQELKDTSKDVKNWCKYNLSKSIRKQIGKGAFGTVYKACLFKSCDPPLIVRVIEYDNHFDTVPREQRPENVEWKIHKLLYETLLDNGVFNITVPIFSYSCKISDLLPELKSKLDLSSSPRCVRITFTDFANGGSMIDVLEKVKLKDAEFLHLILQVLLTLCTIYKEFQDYRHNDLHIGNILIVDHRDEMMSMTYDNINGKNYTLKAYNLMILLNDFDYNSISYKVKNAKVKRNLPDVVSLPSTYYDVHKFINSMLTIPDSSAFNETSKVKKFLREIVPLFVRGNQKSDYLDYYQIVNSKSFESACKKNKFMYQNYTPDKIIKNRIFEMALVV